MLSWHYVTRAAFDAASEAEKTSDKLFYLSDTGEIYRGTQSFSESVVVYTEEPTVKAVGKLYVKATTLEGKIWNGTSWKTVIQAAATTLSATDTLQPVSGKAVSDFVKSQIESVTGSGDLVAGVAYTSATNTLTATMADGTTNNIPLTNVAADLVYDKATGLLQVKNAQGTTIGNGISLDLERFVQSASYDHDTGKITLVFNDSSDPLEIEIGDLVDTYTAANSSTVKMTVTGNQFTAEAIVSKTAGNLLQATDKGLYVAIDLSGYMVRDTDAVKSNLAMFDANGNAVDAGVTAGAATLSGSSASVLATEAAVAAIRNALQSAVNNKMAKVTTGKADEVLVATADGNSKVSGVKVGGATMAASPNAATLATEAAVNTYVTGYAVAKASVVANGSMNTTVAAASDELVPSEKALVAAISWNTTI